MDKFNKLKNDYDKLRDEFETYQNFAENTIQMVSEKNNELEKKLDALTNIVEISKYINLYLSDDNIVNVINDMIVGILGVNYSTIYINDDEALKVRASNINSDDLELHEKLYECLLNKNESFIINCKDPKYELDENKYSDTHSIIGLPINLRDKQIGFLVVEHVLIDFFTKEHIKFISSITNQIGIALENNMLYKQIKDISIKDPLMGIYNRKHFFELINEIIENDNNKKFAIVMIDIDNFKKFNDNYGHQFGDYVLIKTSEIIKSKIDSKDIIARYGGEELILYLDNVHNKDRAYQKMENIRKSLSGTEFIYDGTNKRVTASFGISFYPDNGLNLEEVINISDNLLYKAKKMGKNRVECA